MYEVCIEVHGLLHDFSQGIFFHAPQGYHDSVLHAFPDNIRVQEAKVFLDKIPVVT
jgi:hypothetical protein